MTTEKFPVGSDYENRVLDGVTISRSPTWWTAILAIADRRTKQPFLMLYQWKKEDTQDWQIQKSFMIRRRRDIDQFVVAFQKLAHHLPGGGSARDRKTQPADPD